MRNYPYHFENHLSYDVDINSFYKNLNGTSFKGVTVQKLKELKENSRNLLKLLKNPKLPPNKPGKYIRIMNSIKTNPTGFGVTNEAEKYIFFMFCIDPNFEAAKISGECNKTEEVKEKMISHFGLFDKRLIIIENFFIKNFLTEKKRNEIKEEIENRVFK